MIFDYEDALATYRIDAISYVPNDQNGNPNPPAWEATCVEVLKRDGREWGPKLRDCVTDDSGREVVKHKAYVGYTLAELFDPEVPTPREWVDQYAARHVELAASDHKYGEVSWYTKYKANLRAAKRKKVSGSFYTSTKKRKR